MDQRLTIVVTTSPIPSHPSPALLRALFASFAAHLPGFERCPRVLVCDGYRRPTAGGKPQLCSEEAYNGFLDEVDRLSATGTLGPCRVLRLESVHGYGLALGRALEVVETEFVLVVQHDWLLVQNTDLCAAMSAMDSDGEVKCIALQSLTTLGYAKRLRVRYNIELPPSREVCGLTLTPQLFWYDKPHICRAQHYREVVLRNAPNGVGECPERKYGLEFMWPRLLAAGDRLEEVHREFGVFFWDVGAEVIYHLSGRKLRAAEELPTGSAVGSDAAPSAAAVVAELHGEARATTAGGYTAAAAERAALVPGLALAKGAEARISAAQGEGPRQHAAKFKGRCFICGLKGHSKLLCPARPIEPGLPPEECSRQVIAGC
mmetsp:Transcript_56629/g.184205  ORF Transcript_56629/g.184205 Transcript_56629/m.184205 type:complete len:375 (+) Transcript_56629:152-1276(+)